MVKAEEAQQLVPSKKERFMMWHEWRYGTFVAALVLCSALLAGRSGQSNGASDPIEEPGNSPNPVDGMALPVQIRIDNFTFNPSEVTIPVGTKVTWTNHDDVPHTATSSLKPREFDSGTLDTDDQFSYVFTAPGTYDYFCAVHKHMTARIIVK
jgi:plastocyanin